MYNSVGLRKAHVNSEPIFILGNPKSGTTAIAQLFSLASSKSLTSDFQRAIPRHTLHLELNYNLISFPQFIKKYTYEFSKEIIKSPMLTFFTDELLTHFPNAKFVFIVRDPYQNIRSILNRLNLPGNLETLDFFEWDELNTTPAWKLHMQSRMLGHNAKNYIEAMAFRWNYAVDKYIENKDRFILVKYEDFVKDKENYIYQLCDKMDIKVKNNISSKINVQFQPKGESHANIPAFFGEQNLNLINKLTEINTKKLEYPSYS